MSDQGPGTTTATAAGDEWHPTACILCSANCGVEVRLDGSNFPAGFAWTDDGTDIVDIWHVASVQHGAGLLGDGAGDETELDQPILAEQPVPQGERSSLPGCITTAFLLTATPLSYERG